ncbi:hypothetical protein IUY40_17865 [Flavobacterium sp. ALJ2]|uniref:hypothetical protein n=1 Tax=Flavobacterium sp. ALJ2 TaxID=2786960 RepID=UPI0018A05406|nr:hypothetical protein [Flavobacterium sp. ALJ2]MBF7093405.1 hypothetical protein [Flavobacterium sp. ALJ2]
MGISGEICFLGNPYPNGHKLIEFVWSGRVEEDESLWFDFHLKTDSYYADDNKNEQEEERSDWNSKVVWENYQNCIISSTYWGSDGIKINKSSQKAVFNDFINQTLIVDSLPFNDDFEYDRLAFEIFLLGHDTCADHKLEISLNTENNYDIEWSGKIALSYLGDDKFNHDFVLKVQNIAFNGFYYPKSWSLEKADIFFKNNFEDYKDYQFVDLNPKSNKREYKFKKIN